MNIKILDSWLREYLTTKAAPEKIGELLSLSSVSVERIEPFEKNDFVYDIEVTTNRPDLMSVLGIAREASVILSQAGISAEFKRPILKAPLEKVKNPEQITIKIDRSLIHRICTVIMEVNLSESPQYVKDRLEASDIRSLNNVIDVTNYVMREIGHPTHVFDYDRLTTKALIIRESRKGEKVTTLDEKTHTLSGGDIVAGNGEGEIVDLLGVMGTANSVVTDNTKRILYFIDTIEASRVRKTSMNTGIRTEAAILNEKGIDPELAMDALLRGIDLYKKTADAKLLSNIIDMYPRKILSRRIFITEEKVNSVIGVKIPSKTIKDILERLGFEVKPIKDTLQVIPPSWRVKDVTMEEDIIEEVARIYGYHKLPNILPPQTVHESYQMEKDALFWEKRVKHAFKYWGFTEVYTNSLVSEELLEGSPDQAVKLKNPLTDDMVYLRKTIVPSLLAAARENQARPEIKIFELSNVYEKKVGDLPNEVLTLAAVFKQESVSFYEVKGIVETLLEDLGIKEIQFKKTDLGGLGSDVFIGKTFVGEIEVLEENIIDFEFNFSEILKHVSLKKTYKPISKFPPIIEDLRIIVDPNITFSKIVALIKKQSDLISQVSLLDIYEDKKTFRITYLRHEKNLTNEDIAPVRKKITAALQKDLRAKVA